MSNSNSVSAMQALTMKMVILLNDHIRERATGTVVEHIAWPNPSISGAKSRNALCNADFHISKASQHLVT